MINLVHNAEQKGEQIDVANLAASFQKVAIGMIIDRVLKAVNDFPVAQVVLAGGVSANSYLRSELPLQLAKKNIPVIRPPMWCCTDQAAMIAKLAEHLYQEKIFANFDLGVDPNWQIDDYRKF